MRCSTGPTSRSAWPSEACARVGHHPLASVHQPFGGRVARIAVVAGPDAGHALPAIGVGAALLDAGHQVRLFTGEGHDRTAADNGLCAERLPLLRASDDDDDLGRRIWGRAAQMAPPLAALLAPWDPDLVVADTLTRCGAFAAQLLDRAWVELIPHHLDDMDDDLPPVGLGRPPATTTLRRLDDRRINHAQRRSVALGRRHALLAARSIGLVGVRPPARRLVGTLPALERTRRSWPGDAVLVGPLAVDPAGEVLAPPDGLAPLVVVTDSTASGVDRSLGAVAIEALQGLDVRLVVTSGWLEPRTAPGLVVGRGPHGPLLVDAALAVGPGGAGFVGKAAAAGVPLVTVPFQGDQLETAARLQEQGAGRTLRLRALTPRRLRWTVVRHLADADARRAAAVLAEQARALTPARTAQAVAEVLAVAPRP
jgi:UDP:flavonoid glycosyltransferase YjiC (YdhE family)